MDFAAEEDRKMIRIIALERQRGGVHPERYEFKMLRADGTKIDVENHVSVIDYEGEPASLSFVRDITERKRLEAMLQEHTENLEEMVEEKTKELLDAERMVTAGKVASMLGHDLRGPLQVINNAVYLLKESPEKSGEMLKMIEVAIQRATKMLEEFRQRTRDLELNVETIDLSALIRGAVEESQIPKSVNVVFELGDGLVDVSLDPLKMRRVLDNLIANALDAMPDGGVMGLIAERRGDKVVISVADTGVGIPEDEMSRIFKPFHTTKTKGMGLGLAYCKRAIEAHSGTISVESKEGEGTTFTIILPLKHDPKTENISLDIIPVHLHPTNIHIEE